jgi:hypothetical protein
MSKRTKKNKKKNKTTKAKGKVFKRAAATGVEKFKIAAEFVYKHRDKIKEAAQLVAAVLGTASQILGKPGKSRAKSRDRKRKS